MKIGSVSISLVANKDDPNDRKWVIQNGWGDKVSVKFNEWNKTNPLERAIYLWWDQVEKRADDEYSGQAVIIEE